MSKNTSWEYVWVLYKEWLYCDLKTLHTVQRSVFCNHHTPFQLHTGACAGYTSAHAHKHITLSQITMKPTGCIAYYRYVTITQQRDRVWVNNCPSQKA